MNNNLAMIQQTISKDTVMNVRSFKDFHDYTKKDMARRMADSIEEKMEYSCTDEIRTDNFIVQGKVVIMSPKEYQELLIERAQLKREVNRLKEEKHEYSYYRPRDTGGTIPDERRMTPEENRSFWGIFG
ncbi:hypothetical protein Q9R38_26075 [Priestia aryabhattai]|uniref:hypothetical protein n=1 Tax=Priestia aryabhattai TaxID=412384 RepID=UPI002880D4ED|nr:hypothetical protein [Priestia aryabhattai]MDT0150012.1 hypothetical protein [Priestia aryabhattai]MDT0155582.1 hypothetical protein [Priestia aryabhattai]